MPSLHLLDPDFKSEQQQNIFLKFHFEFAYFSLSLTHLKCPARKPYWKSLVCHLLFQAVMHFKRLLCRVKRTMDVTPCLVHKALVEYNCCAGYRRPQTSSSLKVKGIFALTAGWWRVSRPLEFSGQLSRPLPCEQRFLFCMALIVYEVIRVACLSRSWLRKR